MASPLTNDEITRMHHLDEEGASDKVIAVQICREFNRETRVAQPSIGIANGSRHLERSYRQCTYR